MQRLCTVPGERRPTAGFWIAVVVLTVLVGYPLSFGPACWISSRQSGARPARSCRGMGPVHQLAARQRADVPTLSAAYAPIGWLAARSRLAGDVSCRSAQWGMPVGTSIYLPTDWSGSVVIIAN
jgi:hypothetical protein